eukprot:3772084-Alexandrium_andersonii.AAC.1
MQPGTPFPPKVSSIPHRAERERQSERPQPPLPHPSPRLPTLLLPVPEDLHHPQGLDLMLLE